MYFLCNASMAWGGDGFDAAGTLSTLPLRKKSQLRRMPQRRPHERPVEVAVEALAGGFGDEEAAVTGGAFEKPFRMIVLGRVTRADGIVGAELSQPQGSPQMPAQVAALLHQAAQGSLRSRAARGEEDRC